MEKTHNKIIAVSFVAGAAFIGYVVSVLITVLSNTWGPFARIASNPMVEHGVPVAVGAICFFYFILNKRIKSWAADVVAEVSKVVWPSINDTRALTIVVCIIILAFSFILSVFDYVSSEIVQFILDMEI